MIKMEMMAASEVKAEPVDYQVYMMPDTGHLIPGTKNLIPDT